ncbi:putative protein, putative phage repressor [Campylobacter iguaniorum]|uniref:helix-turn-helix domain-containing protein n=1 Tax=Campylobacter iguaniorum TaxID=1244531 RepID=UPI00073A3D80|nr:helix-turn-helix domain-containing protein [Campylobacter iguaniorum]ALV24946.1 putative protein, putative phage repressor [Campylobacter iguaniorum]
MKTIDEIFGRLKYHFGVKTDKELAEVLGLPYKTLDSWKFRNRMPKSRIIDISTKENLPIEWILNGEGLGSFKAFAREYKSENNSNTANLDRDININLKSNDFNNDSEEIKELISLLKYASKDFITQVIERLKEFQRISKI